MSSPETAFPLSEVKISEIEKQLQLIGGIVSTHELHCPCNDCGLYVEIATELARRGARDFAGSLRHGEA